MEATPLPPNPSHNVYPSPSMSVNTTTPSRYESLLHQIVQLNTDLQKTAALSQSLQHERDGLVQTNHKVFLHFE